MLDARDPRDPRDPGQEETPEPMDIGHHVVVWLRLNIDIVEWKIEDVQHPMVFCVLIMLVNREGFPGQFSSPESHGAKVEKENVKCRWLGWLRFSEEKERSGCQHC